MEFVTKNHNLILSYLGKYNLRYDDFYDVLSIALCKAAATFDSSRGVAFSTYAYKCFFNAVGSEIRKIKRQIGAEGNLIHITNENEDKISYDSVALNIDAAVDIKKIIDKYDINEYLTPKEKEAYEYLSKGYTQTEIAKTLGKSKQCVSIK